MKKLMIFPILMIVCSMNCYSQSDANQGIAFEQGTSWQEVLQQAKEENKYILVDCYTTWCGPCKLMEQTVYPQKAVGEAYNKDFISVKVQMDQTTLDDAHVKGWYGTAKTLETTYTVNSYPTYLFFDPEGKPVHKVSGSFNTKDFIQVAADARNPDKQYYAILKNFRPGKLDTGEEKGLAYSFRWTNSSLASNIALDYLMRIPRKTLGSTANMRFLTDFCNDSATRQFADCYIDRLPEAKLYDREILLLLGEAAMSKRDRAFRFLYAHPAKVDTIIKRRNWSRGMIIDAITRSKWRPMEEKAKTDGATPDFVALDGSIRSQYDAYYADWVTMNSKVDWYNYLVKEKSDSSYWPQLLQARIDREQQWLASGVTDFKEMNNISWDIFGRSQDSGQLKVALGWMEQVYKNSKDPDMMDTYACVAYRLGKSDEALQAEQQALRFWIDNRKHGTMTYMIRTMLVIREMCAGKQIWFEKEIRE